MDTTEQQKILERIGLLLNLKLEHGCLPGEVEVAAYKIGLMVQKYGLAVSFPQAGKSQQSQAETAEQRAERQNREAHQKFEEEIRRAREAHARRQEEKRSRPSLNFEYGEVTVIGETEKALFLRNDEDETEFWIPRSQCREGCQHWGRGDSGVLWVSRWWAEKEGWT